MYVHSYRLERFPLGSALGSYCNFFSWMIYGEFTEQSGEDSANQPQNTGTQEWYNILEMIVRFNKI